MILTDKAKKKKTQKKIIAVLVLKYVLLVINIGCPCILFDLMQKFNIFFLEFNHSEVFCMLFLMLWYLYFLTICEEEEVFLSKTGQCCLVYFIYFIHRAVLKKK